MNRIAFLISLTALTACSSREDTHVMRAVAELRNSDVEWDGNYFGLKPTISGSSAKYLADNAKIARKYLLNALDDPEQFAVAHVLLTELQEGASYSVSATHWNGLRVTLHADGRVQLFPEDRSALKEFWHKKL